MGKLYSLGLPPAIGMPENFVRLGYIHLHLFHLEIDVYLISFRQRLKQSTSLHISRSSIFDDYVHHLINCIKTLRWFPVSCRSCVCRQLLQHSPSTSSQPWWALRLSNSKKSKTSWFSQLEFYIIILHKIAVPWSTWVVNNKDKVESSI